MTELKILSKEELDFFKNDLISQITQIQNEKTFKKWLRSKEVCEMLSISPSVLQQLRINGDIPAVKLSTGTWLYPYEGIVEALESKIVGGRGSNHD